MRYFFAMLGVLAGYTLIWAGLSHYGLPTVSGPLPPAPATSNLFGNLPSALKNKASKPVNGTPAKPAPVKTKGPGIRPA